MIRPVRVEFECVVCGQTAVASVSKADVEASDCHLETPHDCPNCEMETIWNET